MKQVCLTFQNYRLEEKIGRVRHHFRKGLEEREQLRREEQKETAQLNRGILEILADDGELNNVKRLSNILNVESKAMVSQLRGLQQVGLIEGKRINGVKTMCYFLTEKAKRKSIEGKRND